MKMAEDGLRRSSRVRKQVKSYASEQADAEDVALSTKQAAPKRKRKPLRKRVVEEDESDTNDSYDGDAVVRAPAKESKRSKTKSNDGDDARADGSVKNGLSLFFEGVKPTPEGSSWHASAAERRIAVSNRDVRKLAPGEQEIRLRPFVETPSNTYTDALKRANTQRMFVLNRERGVEGNCHANHDDCPCETVEIAGSTGNVYTVRITHKPTCTCPAGIFKRKGEETLCKHALYILHNVLKAPEHLKQQNAFLTSELKEIFASAPSIPSLVAVEEDIETEGRKAVEGDCPICFMEFEDGEEIVWCRAACGNNIHKDCFDQWARTRAGRVTCPFCRSAWESEAPRAQKVNVATINIPEQRGKSGYRNVREQLDYGD